MKICPQCSFENENGFPLCAWCNAQLVDVKATPSTDPNSEEHQRELLVKEHHEILKRELLYSSSLYCLGIALATAILGFVFQPLLLTLMIAGAAIVVVAVNFRIVGQLTTCLLQGALSFAIFWWFDAVGPFHFYMLFSHIILATAYWHWTNMIIDAHR